VWQLGKIYDVVSVNIRNDGKKLRQVEK